MGRFDALTQLDKKSTSTHSPTLVEKMSVSKSQEPQKTSLLAKKQTSKEVNNQTSLLVNSQTSREVNQQGSKLLKKFGSYLPPETIKALKRYAFDNDRKEYEVLKEAIDFYLDQKKA